VITQILELDYDNKGNVVLFKCEWFDNRVQDKWVKVDKFGITHVNRKHLIHTGHKSSDAPFILASQATQVYYVEDPLAPDWLAVRQATNQRDLYDMFGMGDENSELANGPTGHNLDPIETISIDLKDIPKTRTDIDGVLVSAKENPKFVMFTFIIFIGFKLNMFVLILLHLLFRKKNGKGRRVKRGGSHIR
jgi:hypothetical protein